MNTITGAPLGLTVQAHSVHGSIGNATHHTGERIDFSGATFHVPLTGKPEEHHRPDTTRGGEHP